MSFAIGAVWRVAGPAVNALRGRGLGATEQGCSFGLGAHMLRAMSSLDHTDRDEPRHERAPRRDRPRPPTPGFAPRVRRGALRIPSDAAFRLRTGHPWVFRDTIGDRPVSAAPGEALDLLDPEGNFVARGLYDPEEPLAVRIVSRDPQETFDDAAILRRVR